jgi:hypothetical protein
MASLYADSVAEMIDRHTYFGGGEGRYSISPGQVSNATHLDQPGRGLLTRGLFQMADRPFSVSEWSMLPPSPWKAEAAPLIAFYGMGLQGWDASYHFNAGTDRMGDGWPDLRKHVSHTPHYMGQFPALALAVHESHIKGASTVAARVLARDDIFSGREALRQAPSGGRHDEETLADNPSTPAEALAIGRVTIAFGDGKSSGTDVTRFWDRKGKVLRSVTGELEWDYGDRIVQVRAPKTHGVIGFAGGRRFDLPALRVDVKTPFVSLLFTALDAQDLESSKQILITAMAREKQSGAEFNEDWSQLRKVGSPPLLMEPVQASVRLKGATPPTRVRPLDLYGVPQPGKTIPLGPGGSFKIDGTHRTYYYVIER